MEENEYKDAIKHYKFVINEKPDYPKIKANYYLAYFNYIYNSIFFRIIILIILIIIIAIFVVPKIFKNNKKSGKHYRGRNRF